MKLLLDAPEHLWRLIERREYYRATWLFLLSRGVHRAFTHDDVVEGPSWTTKGISITVTETLPQSLNLDSPFS